MPVLALDTSSAVAVALTEVGGGTLAARRRDEPRRHVELLAELVAEVHEETGVRPGDLDAVVVGTGPAPFTGLRVGIAAARAFAAGAGARRGGLADPVPVYGVPSLDAVAAQVFVAGEAGRDGTEVLVVTDARRKEVYFARYAARADGDVDVLNGPGVDSPAAVAQRAARPGGGGPGGGGGAVVVGRGVALYPDHFPQGVHGGLDPDPAVLARLALVRAARGLDQPTEPLYLRRPDAQVPGAPKRVLA